MNANRTPLTKTAIALLVGFAALAIGGTAQGRTDGPDSKTLVVKLKPRNGSGVVGSARLIPAGRNLRVVVTLSKAVPGSLPAHIHTGPCSREPTYSNPRLRAGLNNLEKGRSVTLVTYLTLRDLRGSFSINVHESAYPNKAIACGDLPRVSRTPATSAG